MKRTVTLEKVNSYFKNIIKRLVPSEQQTHFQSLRVVSKELYKCKKVRKTNIVVSPTCHATSRAVSNMSDNR